ncbi:MAG: phage tail sheath subtilisin-like domain-containing protein [Aeromonas sp.]
MTIAFHHGVRVTESTDLSTLIRDIDSAVIGVVCTADDADSELFPLDTPVLLTRVLPALGKAGTTGTLYPTLKAISDQASPKVVVVRVAEAKPELPDTTQDQLVIGGSGVDGRYTGMFALLTAELHTGVKPRLLAAPNLDSEAVTAQLVVIAQKLRAFCYAGIQAATIAEAKNYAETFSQRELMLIYPDFIAFDSVGGSNVIAPAAAYALGLRAKLDAELGWHKSLSNVAVNNVLGVSADIYWSLQDTDTDANDLNAAGVTTLIKRDGFRFWGNRTRDNETYCFEVYTRTAQILADTVAEAHFSYVDKPLTPSLVKDIVDGINQKLSALVTAGKLLGANCWFDPSDNPTGDLRDGKLLIRYNYTPVPPLESLGLVQTFTDQYFATFENLA